MGDFCAWCSHRESSHHARFCNGDRFCGCQVFISDKRADGDTLSRIEALLTEINATMNKYLPMLETLAPRQVTQNYSVADALVAAYEAQHGEEGSNPV